MANADIKISALTSTSSNLISSAVLPIVQGGTTLKTTIAEIGTLVTRSANVNFANVAGTVSNSSQPTITSVGTLTGLNVNGNGTNVNIINGGGNLVVGNSTIPTGLYVYGAITADSIYAPTITGNISGNITSAGNISANNITLTSNVQAGNINATTLYGQIGTGTQSFITNFDNTLGITVGNTTSNTIIKAGNIDTTGDISANSITLVSNVQAGNVNTTTVNATVVNATTLTGTLATAAQPSITSVGTLTGLTVSGTTTTNTANIGGFVLTGPVTPTANIVATITHTVDVNINGIPYKLMLTT